MGAENTEPNSRKTPPGKENLPTLKFPFPGSNSFTIDYGSDDAVSISLGDHPSSDIIHALAMLRQDDPSEATVEFSDAGVAGSALQASLNELRQILPPNIIDTTTEDGNTRLSLNAVVVFTASDAETFIQTQLASEDVIVNPPAFSDTTSAKDITLRPVMNQAVVTGSEVGDLEKSTRSKYTEPELSDLIVRTRDGDQQAANDLLGDIMPSLKRYCRARLGGTDRSSVSADDVAQEVSMAVLNALPTYRLQGRPFFAFVYGIASHKVIDAHRASGRNRTDPVAEVPDREIDDDPALYALQTEQREKVSDLLGILPSKHAEILTLRIAVGLTAEETAEAIGSTPGAVRVAQHRALVRLRKVLQERNPHLNIDTAAVEAALAPSETEEKPKKKSEKKKLGSTIAGTTTPPPSGRKSRIGLPSGRGKHPAVGEIVYGNKNVLTIDPEDIETESDKFTTNFVPFQPPKFEGFDVVDLVGALPLGEKAMPMPAPPPFDTVFVPSETPILQGIDVKPLVGAIPLTKEIALPVPPLIDTVFSASEPVAESLLSSRPDSQGFAMDGLAGVLPLERDIPLPVAEPFSVGFIPPAFGEGLLYMPTDHAGLEYDELHGAMPLRTAVTIPPPLSPEQAAKIHVERSRWKPQLTMNWETGEGELLYQGPEKQVRFKNPVTRALLKYVTDHPEVSHSKQDLDPIRRAAMQEHGVTTNINVPLLMRKIQDNLDKALSPGEAQGLQFIPEKNGNGFRYKSNLLMVTRESGPYTQTSEPQNGIRRTGEVYHRPRRSSSSQQEGRQTKLSEVSSDQHPYEYVSSAPRDSYNRLSLRDIRTGIIIPPLSEREARLLMAIPVSAEFVPGHEIAREWYGKEAFDKLESQAQLDVRHRMQISIVGLRRKIPPEATQILSKKSVNGGYRFDPGDGESAAQATTVTDTASGTPTPDGAAAKTGAEAVKSETEHGKNKPHLTIDWATGKGTLHHNGVETGSIHFKDPATRALVKHLVDYPDKVHTQIDLNRVVLNFMKEELGVEGRKANVLLRMAKINAMFSRALPHGVNAINFIQEENRDLGYQINAIVNAEIANGSNATSQPPEQAPGNDLVNTSAGEIPVFHSSDGTKFSTTDANVSALLRFVAESDAVVDRTAIKEEFGMADDELGRLLKRTLDALEPSSTRMPFNFKRGKNHGFSLRDVHDQPVHMELVTPPRESIQKSGEVYSSAAKGTTQEGYQKETSRETLRQSRFAEIQRMLALDSGYTIDDVKKKYGVETQTVRDYCPDIVTHAADAHVAQRIKEDDTRDPLTERVEWLSGQYEPYKARSRQYSETIADLQQRQRAAEKKRRFDEASEIAAKITTETTEREAIRTNPYYVAVTRALDASVNELARRIPSRKQ